MAALLSNNAEAQIASPISAGAITITLKAGQGAVFPSPTGSEWFPVTLYNLSDDIEITHCTGRSGDTLTVLRGMEGTTARSWLADDGADLRFTEAVFDTLVSSVATATTFVKADGSQPAWTAPTTTTLETSSDFVAVVGSTVIEIASGTAVTLPTLSAGTDYTIYAATDGSLQAVDADSAAPASERKLGGFHASAGASEIVEPSLWDLNFRSAAPSPRGAVLSLDQSNWADIYLCDTGYAINGYSRNGQQIADDGSLPIIPAEYGGDGTTAYASASWWTFVDIVTAAGKRLPSYQEFTALAYGVVERQAVGTDPGTTQHQAGHRSACGVEQATGVMQQWGADIAATAGSAWLDIADGRGDIYASNIKAPLFGASWLYDSNAGSRASDWNSAPDASSSSRGARALSDHLNLQSER